VGQINLTGQTNKGWPYPSCWTEGDFGEFRVS
jgi:hypothetical protein